MHSTSLTENIRRRKEEKHTWGRFTAGDYKHMRNKSEGKAQYWEYLDSLTAGSLLRSDNYVSLD